LKTKIDVLDHGYIRLEPTDVLGNDLKPVNAAKVSYDKRSTEFGEKEKRLTEFLAKENHSSPFRHALLTFECYAPLMVARQWWKYIIGSGHKEFDGGLQDPFTAWNESSRRYITEDTVFYIPLPEEWRSKPENSKQGSREIVPLEVGQEYTDKLIKYAEAGTRIYNEAMSKGVCAEQARMFLPAYGLYVRWYWTASLPGVAHFLNQRLEHGAQKEIQTYAKAVQQLAEQHFPVGLSKLVKDGR